MANFALCYDNQADTATLTLGSWTTGLPLANLKDYRLSKKARTSNANASSTKLRFTLAAASSIEALSLAATNCSIAATYRWRLYSDAAFTTQIYDSTTLSLFPAGSMPNAAIPTGAPNAGTGQPTLAEARRFQVNINHILSAPQYAQYGQLEITDTANADGYIEAGRLFVGRVFQPAKNPEYGAVTHQLTSRSEHTEAFDGTPYFTAKQPFFAIPFTLKWLTQDEAMRALDIQAIVDTVGEVLVICDPADSTYWWRRQLLGRLKQLDPIQFPRFATYAAAFQVEGPLQ